MRCKSPRSSPSRKRWRRNKFTDPYDGGRLAQLAQLALAIFTLRQRRMRVPPRKRGGCGAWTCAELSVRVRQIYATTLLSLVKRRDVPANTFVPEGGRETRRNTSDGVSPGRDASKVLSHRPWQRTCYECPSLHSRACELPISRSMTTLWLSTLRKGLAPV
jgi:hypothetical protein